MTIDMEQLSKRELIELIKSLMKEIRQMKRELGYERTEKLSQMFKPVAQKQEPKTPGAKEGHEGSTRPKPKNIDQRKFVSLKRCPKGHKIKKIKESRERVVEDIEFAGKVKVTKYVLQGYWCRVCKRKIFPKIYDAMPKFRLGMNFCNYVCERKFAYRMTYNLIQKDLLENFCLNVSQASIVNAVHAVAQLLGNKYEQYKQSLRNGNFVNIDETGWRVNGSNFWLWKFKSKDTVITVIDWKRSSEVPNDVIGEDYSGIVISDGYQAYNKLKCRKQRCWTHILRNTKKLTEKHKTDAVHKFHKSLKKIYSKSKKTSCSKKHFENKVVKLYKHSKSSHLRKTKKFLFKHLNELFMFLDEPIDSTNNEAERAIRPDVVIRKISGGNRSYRGKRSYEVVSSVMQTCQLRKEDFSDIVMEELKSTANG